MPTEQQGLNQRNNPFNPASTRQNACDGEDLFHPTESSEEQDHNMWNEGLNLFTEQNTGLHIQSCLSNEELGRVAISCHFVVGCLCAKLYTF